MWDHHTHGQVRLWICSNNEKCQSAGGATGNDHWRQWDLSFWNSVEYVQSMIADLYKVVDIFQPGPSCEPTD